MSLFSMTPTLLADDSSGFSVRLGEQPLRTTVVVCGALDFETAPVLAEVLDGDLRPESGTDRRDVVVDLAGVDFLDSRGLDVLDAAGRRLAEVGARLRLANASDRVLRVFVLGLAGHLLDGPDAARAAALPTPAQVANPRRTRC